MTTRIAATATLFVGLVAGCSSTPAQKAEPVDVTVTVTLPSGQAAKNLTLNLFPTSSDQIQGGGKTDANGKVKTKLTPGKYTFALEGEAALQAVPKKYHSNDAANTLDVVSGTADIAIKLSN